MYYMYASNYRGFSNFVIPIYPTNFFVGENSTGKTSILALMELFLSPEFYYRKCDFNIGYYNFGNFNDIVSASSLGNNEFQIGLMWKERGESVVCYIMNFVENSDGLPELHRFSRSSDGYAITLCVPSKKYCFTTVQEYCAGDKSPEASFESLKEFSSCVKNKKLPEVNIPRKIKDTLLWANDEKSIFSVDYTVWQLMLHETKSKDKRQKRHMPAIANAMISLAPIRTKPSRIYDGVQPVFNPEGDHIPYLIRQITKTKDKRTAFNKSIERFGQGSGMFGCIALKQFGRRKTSPFELSVNIGEIPLRINSVGYGVSQVLPVLVELISGPAGAWYCIQQPEVHLHPKAQAALGDVLFDAVAREDKTIIIETHSDYLIDRFRINHRDFQDDKRPCQVVYFERVGRQNTATAMLLDQNGDYPEDQPDGFRSFFLSEQRNLLGF